MTTLAIFSLIIFLLALAKFIIEVKTEKDDYTRIFLLIIISLSFAMTLELFSTPSAEDVYNGNTTIEYRLRDGQIIDLTIILK